MSASCKLRVQFFAYVSNGWPHIVRCGIILAHANRVPLPRLQKALSVVVRVGSAIASYRTFTFYLYLYRISYTLLILEETYLRESETNAYAQSTTSRFIRLYCTV